MYKRQGLSSSLQILKENQDALGTQLNQPVPSEEAPVYTPSEEEDSLAEAYEDDYDEDDYEEETDDVEDEDDEEFDYEDID